ncbi:MAG: hypothetical protein IPK93_02630 [Solirubrobacterales bacterium]|nr:hypothetical protein [Solirubrobacterales bacterium]
MTTQFQGPSTINNYLSQPLTVGEPDISGPMAVYPVFGGEPVLDYTSMSRAHTQGFTSKELPGGASVRDLLVANPGPKPVLLFEGEEVLGAQQNRTFDTSVLVPVGEPMNVPVICVEAGRWDGTRHLESFEPAAQASHPDLRRAKSKAAARMRSAGLEARADQSEVWEMVADRSQQLGVNSSTGSLNDVYESRRGNLNDMTSAINLKDGQIGAVLQIGNEVIAIDLVSRPEVFADLHAPLIQGYSLDALSNAADAKAEEDVELASDFVDSVVGNRILEKDGIGLGRDFRFDLSSLVGSGLVSGEELVQMSAFTGTTEDAEVPGLQVNHGRIRRPSRRHR